jgi:hypothetical protein
MEAELNNQPWQLPQLSSGGQRFVNNLQTLVGKFAPISLNEMDQAALLNRIDTKYVFPIDQLRWLLPECGQSYRILSVAGTRLNHYRTLYFDTPYFDLYLMHVNERAERYKIRSRQYTDSNDSFLEVKHKTRKDRTIKTRIATSSMIETISIEMDKWLSGIFPLETRHLEPKIWNTFTRITLVNQTRPERVTLDTDITFHWDNQEISLPDIVIAEVKTGQGSADSPFIAQMHNNHIHPQGFSKYCLGISLLYHEVKKNNLKPKMLRIQKISKGELT